MTGGKLIVLFVNRRAGSGSGKALVDDLQQILEASGFEVRKISDLSELAPFIAKRRADIHCVVSAGGDGTVEVVANSVDAEIPIAIFPLGTENLLAKYLKIEPHPRNVVSMISRYKTQRIDAGSANGKLFLVMLSCGFDADVVRRVHEEREGNITHLAYAKPIIDSILSYDYPNLVVEWQDESGDWKRSDCHWAFAFNMPSYAAGLQIVTQGDPCDGRFELATFAGGSFWDGLRQFGAVLMGQHHHQPDFQLVPTPRIRLSSDREDVPYQVDGDPGGFLPVEIEVLPQRLTLIIPE